MSPLYQTGFHQPIFLRLTKSTLLVRCRIEESSVPIVQNPVSENILRMRYTFAIQPEDMSTADWSGNWANLVREVKGWCLSEFGQATESDVPSTPIGGRWRYCSGLVGFWYREDATMFKLRWC
jgi:hypothetical protein